MIKGMTGFGSAEISSGNIKGFIEVKSVNHRYLDIGYYLPVGFASIENRIREILKQRFERGRITVSFKITKRPAMAVGFNREVAKTYLKQSIMFKNGLGVSGNLSLAEVIQLPGVVETREITLEADKLWPVVHQGLKCSLNSLMNMRKREGKSLSVDIKDKLRRMLLQVNKIRSRVKAISKSKKKTLQGEEFLSFQKSSDINEEISRLVHHVKEFNRLINTDGAVGKKLDFIAQEMQRETNTIGSKLQDKVVSNAVIALKTKIEKLREQAQNIE